VLWYYYYAVECIFRAIAFCCTPILQRLVSCGRLCRPGRVSIVREKQFVGKRSGKSRRRKSRHVAFVSVCTATACDDTGRDRARIYEQKHETVQLVRRLRNSPTCQRASALSMIRFTSCDRQVFRETDSGEIYRRVSAEFRLILLAACSATLPVYCLMTFHCYIVVISVLK